jgi:hypothetical protein
MIFDLAKYNDDPFVQQHEKNARWAVSCDGLPVIKSNNVMYCNGFIVIERWCKSL